MTNELQHSINTLITKSISFGGSTIDYIVKQAPDLCRQLITADIIKNSIWIVGDVAVITFFILTARFIYKKIKIDIENDDKDELTFGKWVVLSLILLITILIVCGICHDLCSIGTDIFAPKAALLRIISDIMNKS